ncbi:Selenocysteine-specific elongation factor, partial [Stegodyphus mimosarum]
MSLRVLNINVGVLGHIDSGKTSLSKALSTVSSTASFDKHPQSQERGITLDLGFSSFSVEIPDHIKVSNNEYDILQFTLVDCPGHASLIRTIIGGAQIIDLIMLVVDVTKGMQTQTAECLILGEITCNRLIVVLNKIDLLPVDKKDVLIQKMSKKILKTLEKTKFANSTVVPVAAKSSAENTNASVGINTLIDCLKDHAFVPRRSADGPFVFAVDHCFAIKGQGTVMTGTVIQGSVSISDTVEIPVAKITRKVKSIQMFKMPVTKAKQGDRVGICVTQFDPKVLERGAICTPGYMETIDKAITSVHKIPYFKGKFLSNTKFHISIMHDTVIAKCSFFVHLNKNQNGCAVTDMFDYDVYYKHVEEITSEYDIAAKQEMKTDERLMVFALLHFEKPVILCKDSIYIASKLETDIHANVCRLAFHGKILSVECNKQDNSILSQLKVLKEKTKEGVVDRMVNEYQIIVRDLFKKETNIQIFQNLKVVLSSGEVGIIEGSFGQKGKVNVRIPDGLFQDTIDSLKTGKKVKQDQNTKERNDAITVVLKFEKNMYDTKKKIFQVL